MERPRSGAPSDETETARLLWSDSHTCHTRPTALPQPGRSSWTSREYTTRIKARSSRDICRPVDKHKDVASGKLQAQPKRTRASTDYLSSVSLEDPQGFHRELVVHNRKCTRTELLVQMDDGAIERVLVAELLDEDLLRLPEAMDAPRCLHLH